MEIQFLHEQFTDNDPKLLMDHIQRMTAGEAPFFPTTLSFVYDKLIEKAFTQHTSPGSGLEKSTGGQSVMVPNSPIEASTSISRITPPPAASVTPPSSLQTPAPNPEPISPSTTAPRAWLRCNQCGEHAPLEDLYDGLRCPQCPSRGGKKGRPFMQCEFCNIVRVTRRDDCIKILCRAMFI